MQYFIPGNFRNDTYSVGYGLHVIFVSGNVCNYTCNGGLGVIFNGKGQYIHVY